MLPSITLTSLLQFAFIDRLQASSHPLRSSQCNELEPTLPDYFGGAVCAASSMAETHASVFLKTSPDQCHTVVNGTSKFCAFSSTNFAGSRGISVVTTPARVDLFHKLRAFTDEDTWAGGNEPHVSDFEERDIPGRGRGLFATKPMYRGDRIFSYTPIMLLDSETLTSLRREEWIELEHMAAESLPSKTQEILWDLYGQPNIDPVNDRIDSNAFELELGGAMYYALYPETARLNHDCRPNAAYFLDKRTLTQHVHAITDIAPGTEITITYINPHKLRHERQQALFSSWGFSCSCSLCTLPPELARASDNRLKKIMALRDRLEDWETASPQMARTLISLYKQERLYARSSSAYVLAALTSCADGLRWDTIKYAELGIELGMIDNGFDDDDVQALRYLAEHPEKHSCWLKRHQ